MDIEVCVMLDSTPGEIDQDIAVTLNTNAATAGQLKCYCYDYIIYYAHHQTRPPPCRAQHILTAAKIHKLLFCCEAPAI